MPVPSQAGKAIAALLCCLSLTLTGCSLISSGDAKRDESGVPTETSKADAFKLKLGDCMAEPSGSEIRDVTIIPCSAGHDFEAYAVMNFDGEAYPGDDAVQTQSQDFCGTEFATFVGKVFDDSTLEITYLYPTPDSWKTGDREIMCLIGGAAGAQTTGTLKGSGL